MTLSIKQTLENLFKDVNRNITRSTNTFELIGGYSGSGGSLKQGSISFPKGKYKSFLIELYLGSYSYGRTVIVTEDELLATIYNAVDAEFRDGIVGSWSGAIVLVYIKETDDTTLNFRWYANNTSKITARLYGCMGG